MEPISFKQVNWAQPASTAKPTSIPVPPPFPPQEEWPKNPVKFGHVLDFDTVTKNLVRETATAQGISPYKARQQLIKELNALPDTEKNIPALLEAWNKGDFAHPIFANAELYPKYALLALRQGVLTKDAFATMMWYRTALKSHGSDEKIKTIPLFINDQVNPEAKAIIRQTLKGATEAKLLKEAGVANLSYLDEEQLKKFFIEMRKKPLSEQRFFVVEDIHFRQGEAPTDYDSDWKITDIMKGLRTSSQHIQKTNGINVFGRFKANQKPMRMLPSLSMMQNYLHIKYGANAVTINPVLGLSTIEDIVKNGLLATRDMGLKYPGLNLPRTADLMVADDYDFPYHDFYHAIITSFVPSDHRYAFLKIAARVNQLYDSPFMNNWRDTLIDMECKSYRRELNQDRLNPSENFWYCVSLAALNGEYQSHLEGIIKDQKLSEFTTKVKKELPGIKRIFKEIQDISVIWKEDTGIDVEGVNTISEKNVITQNWADMRKKKTLIIN